MRNVLLLVCKVFVIEEPLEICKQYTDIFMVLSGGWSEAVISKSRSPRGGSPPNSLLHRDYCIGLYATNYLAQWKGHSLSNTLCEIFSKRQIASSTEPWSWTSGFPVYDFGQCHTTYQVVKLLEYYQTPYHCRFGEY